MWSDQSGIVRRIEIIVVGFLLERGFGFCEQNILSENFLGFEGRDGCNLKRVLEVKLEDGKLVGIDSVGFLIGGQ